MRTFPKASAFLAAILASSPALTVYKCGKVYQDLPCKDGVGEKTQIYEDKRTERQRWDAELLRAQQGGRPFLAKYPYIYSLINGQWFRSGLVNGREQVDVVSPSSDPDLARMHASLRIRELESDTAVKERKLQEARAEADRKAVELRKASEEHDKKLREMRRDLACRGRSSLDPVCSSAH